ncbi:MAG: siphovirus ReqiPepy6 Gp37-like family protein, partial [Flavobacteriales bacterium]|nr:siphovirus ReqiPepy6 Gp37-like family protein [Flavobacteriales bacterium]
MELLVYNHDLELIGIIDDAKSIIWHRRYYTAGDFEIILPVNEINIELIQKQYIITKNDSVECGIIENITIEQSDDGELLKAIGRFGSSLLSRRIVFNTTIIIDTYENAMRQLVYENAINPEIVERIIPNLLLGTLNSFSDSVQFQVSYRNLLATLTGLSENSGIGFRVRLNPAYKKLYFETYKALDRSVNQSVNPRVIFSNDYDNLLASIYQSSDMKYSNVALVGGEGEGEDRKMVIVGSGAGLDRYEVFVNAKEIRMEDDITEPQYFAMLATKGAESLMPKVEYFEGNVLAESNVIYKVDYDLGDIVTIENTKWNKRINVQITEITEVYDENGIQVIPVFGQSSPTIQDTIPERDTSGSGGSGSEIVVTPNKALVSDADGNVVSSSVSDTELEYLSGVTSNLQTQLNGKQATINGAASTVVSSNLTVNRAVISDASGKIAVSVATSTELGYLSGVSSNLQTQLNGKQATINGAASTVV